MKWKVLISAPYLLPSLDRFRSWFDEHGMETIVPPVRERLEEAHLLPLVGTLDGAVCGDDRFTARVLEAAPRLKVISKWGTGIDSIDRDAAGRLGIRVCNTPGAFNDAVADTTLGYVLSFARGIPWMDRNMKEGGWEKISGVSLRECVLGIIGVGNIGRAVAGRAAAFGMTLLGNDIVAVPDEVGRTTRLRQTTLDELLYDSDFVTLHCDLNPTSRHLINDRTLGRMKSSAVLVNTSRGPVVDEEALIRALEGGRIRGAALDVFEEEPLPAESPLRRMKNCLLAPHNSNSSPAAWERVHESTLRNLLDGLRTGRRS